MSTVKDFSNIGTKNNSLGLFFHNTQNDNKPDTDRVRFIDLFAGIGGFHEAMKNFNGECVFASDIDDKCRETYINNFNINPAGDITLVDEKFIPSHDILFAGFPCQPFSKGGLRKGFEDTRGTLFFDIVRILKYHKPKYFLLENVPNLVTHDEGNTYKVITETLKNLGYSIPNSPIILSPHQFGVPALRKRMYIPGVLNEYGNFDDKFKILLEKKSKTSFNAYDILKEKYNSSNLEISDYEKKIIKMWDDFYKNIDIKIIGFPIWSDYFKKETKIDIYKYPKWKQDFILKNIELYKRNKTFIDKWLIKNDNLLWVKDTHRKFEWQAGDDISSLYEALIQFRPSGIRAKRPTHYSTLVAMNHNQIIGKYLRRIQPEEAKILQSFNPSFKLHNNPNIALKQLGNSVNVNVIKNVLNLMFK